MYKSFFAGMDVSAPLLALVLFGLTFVAIVVRVVVLSKRQDLSALERLPLDEERTSP